MLTKFWVRLAVKAEIQSFIARQIVGLPDWRYLHRDSKSVSSEENISPLVNENT